MHLGFDPTVSKDACSGTVQQGELCFPRPLALFKAQWVNFGDAVRSYVPVAALANGAQQNTHGSFRFSDCSERRHTEFLLIPSGLGKVTTN